MKKFLFIFFLFLASFIFLTSIAFPQWGGAGAWGQVRDFLRRCTTSIIPSVTNTYDLGSSSRQWQDLYVKNMPTVDGTAIDSTYLKLDGSNADQNIDITPYDFTVDTLNYTTLNPPVAGFDATTEDTLTWGDGSLASFVWTFSVTGTNPTLTFGDAALTLVGAFTADGLDANDNNITNVGDIALDSISSDSGTPISVAKHIYQTGLGDSTFFGNWAGAGDDLTTNNNSFFGFEAGNRNTSGNKNVYVGYQAGKYGATAVGNTSVGYTAGYVVYAHRNTSIGYEAAYRNNYGSDNVFLGYQAGKYWANGTTFLTNPNYSIYIGKNSKGKDDYDSNSIVIGYNAVGIGANTVVLGNDSIVTTALKGDVGIGTTDPKQELHVVGDQTTEDDTPNDTYWDSDVNEGYMWHTEFDDIGEPHNNFTLRRVDNTVTTPNIVSIPIQVDDNDATNIGDNLNKTGYARMSGTDGTITLHGDARKYKTTTVNFNHTIVRANGKPDAVTLGAHSGFSLPVWTDPSDEELYSCKSLPLDLDLTENITTFVGCYLDTANDTKKFQLQLSWVISDLAAHDVLDAGTTDVEVETTTGNDAQYTSYKIPFTIASVADGAAAGNKIGFRLRRIAASGDEIAGEVVVCGMAMRYVIDKVGKAF